MKKAVFVSDSEDFITVRLAEIGYDVIKTVPNMQLDEPVRAHADCALFSPDGDTFFVEQGNYENIVNFFTKGESNYFNKKGKEIISACGIKSPYPDEVKLNCKCFGRKILCNTALVSSEIKEFAKNNKYEMMHCNQGYAACSSVKLNENAAITDDESVYDTLISNGIDCIKVSKGSVKLKGFNYGFIGGCCGMTEKNRIVFAGNINKHSDADKIKSFINKYGIEIINLSDGDLIDIGGIILLNY